MGKVWQRITAAWSALLGRPTVAFCTFSASLHLGQMTQKVTVVGNKFYTVKP